MPKLIDLTGQRFGKLTIICRDYDIQREKSDKEVYWKCQCDCGNIVSKRGHDLKSGKIVSCGCQKKNQTAKINYIDLTNQTFGKLKVLKQADKRIDKHIAWECQCECGNQVIIYGKHLRSGTTQSCGCLKSHGEYKIISILQELGIEFETQKTFETCKNILPLKFDFYIPSYSCIIEYNGIQHYKSISFMGGEDRLQSQQHNDKIKSKWCEENNIILYSIPYTDFSKLNTEYILNLLQGE